MTIAYLRRHSARRCQVTTKQHLSKEALPPGQAVDGHVEACRQVARMPLNANGDQQQPMDQRANPSALLGRGQSDGASGFVGGFLVERNACWRRHRWEQRGFGWQVTAQHPHATAKKTGERSRATIAVDEGGSLDSFSALARRAAALARRPARVLLNRMGRPEPLRWQTCSLVDAAVVATLVTPSKACLHAGLMHTRPMSSNRKSPQKV